VQLQGAGIRVCLICELAISDEGEVRLAQGGIKVRNQSSGFVKQE